MTESEKKTNVEEFSYTQRNEFTSEIFKVEIRNLPIFGISELKKLLKKQLDLDVSKIKSPKRKDFAYVCFRCKEDQEKALVALDGFKWKGRNLKVSVANAIPDPLVKRRREEAAAKAEGNDRGNEAKRAKSCVEATCPLYHMTYEEQLSQKEANMKDFLKEFGKKLCKINYEAKKLINSNDGLPCKFNGLVASPKINAYRNKSEFAIGKNSSGEIVVGFRLGSYTDGSVEVGSVEELPQISEKMKQAALTFQEYVRSSKFEVFNPEHNSGHFRQLTVRLSESNGDIMLIAGIYSANLNETELVELKDEVKTFYDNYDKTVFDCTSLYYQDLRRRESGELSNPVEHLLGKTHIYDVILGLKFRISPLAFFQVNSSGAEVLYQKAIDLAGLKSHSSLLDICCGTGTIGLCFAKYCKEIVGVEIIPDAIEDAKFNAKENGIENCKFYAGNADEYISSIVREIQYSVLNKENLDLIAVVDPPRAGLHNKSISAIRSSKGLNKIIYVSCNPKAAERNWIDLCRPTSKSYRGEPFLPKVAVAVDMFPHTTHTEMVMLFERDETVLNDHDVVSEENSVKDGTERILTSLSGGMKISLNKDSM